VNEKLNFTIDDARLVKEDPDSSFSLIELDFFASGDNHHKLYVDESTLLRTANTIKNCPVVWKYDSIHEDAGSHDPEEVPCGVVPESSEIKSRKLEDGRTMLSTVSLVWKKYSGKILDFFKRDGDKPISVELTVLDRGENENGKDELFDYKFEAVTVLGKFISPAIPLARATVLQFAKEYQEDYMREFSNKYSDIDFTIPKEIKNIAKKSLDSYKEKGINATSVSLAMGRFLLNNEKSNPEKIRAMSKFFNRKVSYDEITLGFFGGKKGAIWSKGIMDKINEIDEKRLSYFDNGEVLTFPYSKLEDVPENMKKLDGVALTLDQINQISKVADAIGVDKKKNGYAIAKSQFKASHMIKDGHWVKKEVKEEMSVRVNITSANKDAEVKFSLTSSQITEILNNALSEVKYGEDQWRRYWAYNFDAEYVYFHDNEASKDFRAKYSIVDLKAMVDIEGKEEVVEGCPVPVEEKEYVPEFAEEDFEAKPADDKPEDAPEDKPKEKDMAVDPPKDGEDKPEDKPEDDTEDKDEPEKKNMSLDSNLDLAALMAMLADETEDYKALVAKHEAGEEMDYAMLCSKMYSKMKAMQAESDAAKEDKDVYMAKNAELQEYKDKIEKQQFDYAVEKTIQEVSDVFTKEEIENAREEVKAFSIENLPAWQSSIKSAAYERIKDAPKKKESFTRMATVHSWLNRDDKPEDVTKEYAKKGWL
jgi:hypothetical protein